jgi:hypothetical protein
MSIHVTLMHIEIRTAVLVGMKFLALEGRFNMTLP